MSGPKMVGITCDQDVIARNNERLRQIGKERYYTGVLGNINIDITNTADWVDNYGTATLNNVPVEYIDESGIIKEIDRLKEKHVKKIMSQKIDLQIISASTPGQLNKLGVQKVKDIPQWKEQFISEMSQLLKKLQEDIKRFNDGIRQNKIANQKAVQEFHKSMEESEKRAHALDGISVERFHMERYTGDEKAIPFMPEKEIPVDPEMLPFALDELAVIEMLQADMGEYSKLDYLKQREKELLSELSEELKRIQDNSENAYSMKSKRAVLQRMRLQYARLDKYVSMCTAEKNAEREERNTLELEYVSFCQALDLKTENYEMWTVEKLQENVDRLRSVVERQESRIYIEETIEDIMRGYGYASISSYQLHNADSVSRIIFEDRAGAKISTSFGAGMIQMNVIGEGENPPTQDEVRNMVHQQEAFCDLYPKIREQLQEKGIHINYENLMPVSAEQVSNEKIVRQKNIRRSTKRFSFRHVQLVSDRLEERTFDDVAVQNYQYIDEGE